MALRDAAIRLPDRYVPGVHDEPLVADVEISVEGVENEPDLLTVHLRTADGRISVERDELLDAITFASGELTGSKSD